MDPVWLVFKWMAWPTNAQISHWENHHKHWLGSTEPKGILDDKCHCEEDHGHPNEGTKRCYGGHCLISVTRHHEFKYFTTFTGCSGPACPGNDHRLLHFGIADYFSAILSLFITRCHVTLNPPYQCFPTVIDVLSLTLKSQNMWIVHP